MSGAASQPEKGVEFKERTITASQVREALARFDREFRTRVRDTGNRFYMEADGKRYPPKRILSLASRLSFSQFNGGSQTNHVLESLGFVVRELATAPPDPRLSEPIPQAEGLVEALFKKSWFHLHPFEQLHISDPSYPGVYLLAYSDKPLLGKQVEPSDVYYVGVSHHGVRARLHQFVQGLEDGGHHSGAKHFYIQHGETPFSELNKAGHCFFVATVSVPAIYLKARRGADDLKRLGVAAQLEWYALARIKEATGSEPPLNVK